jgi:hypothetical protein
MTKKSTCAWCAREQNQAVKPETSHGICERHATAMLAELGVRLVRDRDNVMQPQPIFADLEDAADRKDNP